MKRDYNLRNQLPHMCLPAVIQMILDRNDLYVERNQKNIARYFKPLEVDGLDGTFYSITDMNKQYFIPKGYPLEEKFIPFRAIDEWDDDLKGFMSSFLHSEDDFIVFANYTLITNDLATIKQTISKRDDPKLLHKHCFLVSEIIDRDHVYLVCPETEENGGTSIIKTTLNRIYDAWDYQIDKGGLGYSVIKRKETE